MRADPANVKLCPGMHPTRSRQREDNRPNCSTPEASAFVHGPEAWTQNPLLRHANPYPYTRLQARRHSRPDSVPHLAGYCRLA
eukprot:945803-Prorocentrum_lima.AAC.1